MLKIAQKVIEDEIFALNLLKDNLPSDLSEVIDYINQNNLRVVVSGIGKSGYIAQKISASLASTGTKSFFVHPAEASHGDLGMIDEKDIVLLLSNSGETKELFDIINYCKRFSIKIIAMTMKKNSTLAKNADFLLNIPEINEASSINAPTSSSTMMLALGDSLMVSLYEIKGFTKDDFKIFHPGGKLGAQMLKVKDLMHQKSEIPIAYKDSLMSDVIITITKKGFGCCAILSNDNYLCGIITDGDLRRHMSDNLISLKAETIMTSNPTTIKKNTLASEALFIMSSKNISSLLVFEDNNLQGILHIHDLLRAGVK